MHVPFRPLRSACLVLAVTVAACGVALAQPKGAAPAPAAPGAPPQSAPPQGAPPQAAPEEPLKQIALSEKQIEGVINAQKELDAITAKLPANAPPDQKVMGQLGTVAKIHGFASYEEYLDVMDNINLVLGGFDPPTKKYIGGEAVIKNQLKAVADNKKMPDKAKKAVTNDLNEALKSVPKITYSANIDLVTKYYDQLLTVFGAKRE